ncbi:NB-ARC domain-containing protein [Salmonirosea aquatica]|uniref:Tetratricopeptide repeat protein n=1 Tax=Salmonirosea aquatica TaxID=2654236 RepID=A0A7C9FYA5_9BACT|nr:tetratricopeptide repeat protein [Cytophagaceae bacterium SJW1-29]
MNPLKAELPNIAGIVLSGIAMTACGTVLPDPSIAFKVVDALAPNFAHQFLSGMDYRRFKDFLVRPHPGDLNHDLDQLMKDALLQALHHIETAYLEKLEAETDFTLWQKAKDRPFEEVKRAFKLLRKNLLREEEYQKEFGESLSDDEKIDFDLSIWLRDGSWTGLPKLTNELFKFPEIENEERWQELKNYFEENLPWIYDLSFKEALKDERNLKAYKAFQMFVLETVVQQNSDTHLKLDEIKITLLALENNLQTQSQAVLNNLLENDIRQLRKEINRTFGKVIAEIIRSEKRIIDSVNSKGNEIIEKLNSINPVGERNPVIEKHLIKEPFRPTVFLGRQDDIEDIRRILFDENHLLLLVNGKGGVGKTSLASRYYHEYQEQYSHMAWVLRETSIGDAILALAPNLHIQFDPLQSRNERLDILLTRLSNLKKPCLLVIDNANDYEDLNTYYKLLNRCSNFHILLTTRITEFGQARTKEIRSLPKETALELFQRYYPAVAHEEQARFDALYTAVNGNTLVLELMAKQLKEANDLREKYRLADLIADLQTKGIFRLQHSSEVQLNYQKYQKARPEDVIAALYDLEELSDDERKLGSVMAVLPPEGIQIKTLDILLPETAWWDNALKKLALKGWLDFNRKEKEIKISPVVQEIIRNKNADRLPADSLLLINSLSNELAYEGWSEKVHGENPDYKETSLYALYAESVLNACLSEEYATILLAKRVMRHYSNYLNNEKAKTWFARIETILADKNSNDWLFLNAATQSIMGDVYKSEGRTSETLGCYQKDLEISKSLHERYPEQVSYKNGLGIAYQRLGDVYKSEGRMSETLGCYQKDLEISKSLHERYPEQVFYKNGLGIAYERLGDVHRSEGRMSEALGCYQKYLELMSSLHESYPEQVDYQYSYGTSLIFLGDVMEEMGNSGKEHFLIAYDVYKNLLQKVPNHADARQNFNWVKRKLGK